MVRCFSVAAVEPFEGLDRFIWPPSRISVFGDKSAAPYLSERSRTIAPRRGRLHGVAISATARRPSIRAPRHGGVAQPAAPSTCGPRLVATPSSMHRKGVRHATFARPGAACALANGEPGAQNALCRNGSFRVHAVTDAATQ